MSGNSFEDQLHKDFEEFRVEPSTAVWQKLEQRLGKSGRKRRGIYWLLTATLVAGIAIGYQFVGPSDESQKRSDQPAKTVDMVPQTKVQEQQLPQNRQEEQRDQVADLVSVPEEQMTFGVKASDPRTMARRQTRDLSMPQQQEDPVATATIPVLEEDESVTASQSTAVKLHQPPLAVVTEHKAEATPEPWNIPATVSTNHISQWSQIQNPGLAGLSVANKPLTDSLNPHPLQPPPNLQKRKAPLSLSVRAYAGWSGLAEGINILGESKRADFSNAPAGPGLPATTAQPYTQETSSGWGLGLVAGRQVSKRLTFSAGLLYRQFSTSSSTGNRGTGTRVVENGDRSLQVSSFYTAGSESTYRNRYHLISMPIDLDIRLNPKARTPILAHLGMHPGWMTGSNVLFRDSSGLLFQDKAGLQRFQLTLEAGMSIRLWAGSGRPLDAGPVWSYQLTPAFVSSSNAKGHLYFGGLRMQWRVFQTKEKTKK